MTVYLVGAGPGDPGLLTRRGAELLERADVVVYDRLAHPSLLELAPAGAERVDVGKTPGAAGPGQDEINAVLVDRGRRGRTVVRLKGGDPFVFGRGGEEAEALAAAGVAFEVVPGITSAIAAAAYAGIPVTHRGLSTHFTVVTGHEDPAKGTTDTDWASLARAGGTLVILMGAGNLADDHRRASSRAVARPTRRSPRSAGARCPSSARSARRWPTRPDAGIRAPSAIVVGPVAALDLAWFESRPLFGRTVVITRAREQASTLRTRLETLGAEVVELPAIEIEPHRLRAARARRLLLARVHVGQRSRRLLRPRPGPRRPRHPRARPAEGRGDRAGYRDRARAARDPGRPRPRALRRRGARRRVPGRDLGERAGAARPGREGARRAARRPRRPGLPGRRAGRLPDVPTAPDPDHLERVRAGKVDAVTFTASSTVTGFCDLVGELPDPQPLVISIGPITSRTARDRGLRVDAEADPHTIDGVVDALLAEVARAERRTGSERRETGQGGGSGWGQHRS